MIAPKKVYTAWLAEFKHEKEQDDFDSIRSPVYIVSQKYELSINLALPLYWLTIEYV